MSYTCHSGGCPGADMMWETEGEKYGVKTIAYSFYGHVQEGKNPKILTVEELNEGWEHVLIAEKTLKRNVEGLSSTYTRSLLCRNWFQVKNSEAVFAIGLFDTFARVRGGTGWAVQMAVDSKKPVHVFEQDIGLWATFNYTDGIFTPTYSPIKLTKQFAGIGTRDINEAGKRAIEAMYLQNANDMGIIPEVNLVLRDPPIVAGPRKLKANWHPERT